MYETVINDEKLALKILANTLYFYYNDIEIVYYTKYTMVISTRDKKVVIDLQPMLEYFKKDKTIYGLQRYVSITLIEKGFELIINESAYIAGNKMFKLLIKQLSISTNFNESILDTFAKQNNYIFALVKDNYGTIYECTYYIKENYLISNKY